MPTACLGCASGRTMRLRVHVGLVRTGDILGMKEVIRAVGKKDRRSAGAIRG